jgi:membrane associated rhomboid family serine protease
MFFFPYRLDVSLYRVPFCTVLVCIACLMTFLSQVKSSHAFVDHLRAYCTKETSAELHAILKSIDDTEFGSGCARIFIGIRESKDHDIAIARLAGEVHGLDFFKDQQQDVAYKQSVIKYGFDEFIALVPRDLTDKLAFRPNQHDAVGMFTSTFAHASWHHLIGNLVFFFIFASCVESALGYAGFIGAFALMAMISSGAYSYTVSGIEGTPAIGLSGVAMGMMALLTTMLPRAKIRCFFWFLLFFRRFTLPVLVVAAWYIGWNVYDLNHADPSSNINYMAHVSGAVTGIALGVLYRLVAPRRMEELQVAMQS